MIETQKERFEKLKSALKNARKCAVMQLHKEYLDGIGSTETPLTHMSEWKDYCIKNNVSGLMIDEFQSWHEYFYTNGGLVSTVEDLSAWLYWDLADKMLEYYADTEYRYSYAVALLNGDKYIIRNISTDVVI